MPVNEKIGLADDPGRGRRLLRRLGPAAHVRIRAAGRPERQPRTTPANWRDLLAGRDGAAERDSLQPSRRPAVPHADAEPPSDAFRKILEDAGIRVQFRHRKGDAIDAACGQLRRQTLVQLGS